LRSSRDDFDKHREQIIEAAAQLFRERGKDNVSVPEIMAEVGMTHGGFYRHFPSKDALAPVASDRAFDHITDYLAGFAQKHDGDARAGWAELVGNYLSPAHRDNLATGCPATALAGDIARESDDSSFRQAYAEGITRMLDKLKPLTASGPETYDKALVELSTLVGALVLARATRGHALSEDILSAARANLLDSSS
jgi:TetR/AcrR family transcriptional repressor of nem operon